MKPIQTTTRSLFQFPHIDMELQKEAKLQVDLCKLAIWRADMALRELKEKGDE